ncbi:unnamed protein product [Calypogeia fissa]
MATVSVNGNVVALSSSFPSSSIPSFSSSSSSVGIHRRTQSLKQRTLSFSSSSSVSSSSVAILRCKQASKQRRHQQRRFGGAARASSELVEPLALSSADPDLTWQVTAGAIAGVTPFVIAGIEFSKRIIQRRRCQVCNGSGLVKRAGGLIVRCNGCGGFLPWQSWSRFFSSGR